MQIPVMFPDESKRTTECSSCTMHVLYTIMYRYEYYMYNTYSTSAEELEMPTCE
jgi:hypothetical protein